VIQNPYTQKLKVVGARENEKLYDVGGGIMTATVKDPYGNVIGLVWRVKNFASRRLIK